MNSRDILSHRLHNEQLVDARFKTAAELVQWFGAVQSQDYPAAKWALGLRLPGSDNATIDKAFDEGKILRTHVMRPTWHFVHPTDIQWMLILTASRVQSAMAYYNRLLELDVAFLQRSNDLITKALQGHNYLTRSELATYLKNNSLEATGQRLGHIVMHAELEGIICSGPRKGKQFTYALLKERAPKTKKLNRDASLAELTKRYFISHGPATLKDFVWWSGLTTSDARIGLAFNKSILTQEEIEGKIYWYEKKSSLIKDISQTGYLLPNYDEYTIAYQDRDAFLDAASNKGIDARGNVIFNHSIVLGGKIVGGWRRHIQKNTILISYEFFVRISPEEKQLFIIAANKYGAFFNLPITFSEINSNK